MKLNRALLIFSICCCMLCSKSADAQAVSSDVVTGNTYTCYLWTMPDVLGTDITFADKGGMNFSSYPGNGFYFNLFNVFAGSYLTLNATFGAAKGDLIFYLTGMEFDPFIVGIGFILYEYTDIYFMTFFGIRNIDDTGTLTIYNTYNGE